MSNRILDLTDGVAMLVTDLHGDLDAFERYIARFRRLHDREQAQRLIILGDLIHSDGPPASDHSLRMVMEIIELRAQLGPDTVIMLLGNHEMPHIYGVALSRGEIDYTPRFEHTLNHHRDEIIDFFIDLPFYVRTAAGVMLGHAGPSADSVDEFETLRHFDHRGLLTDADNALAQSDNLDPYFEHFEQLHGLPYSDMAYKLLAIHGPHDPRYSHLLRAFMIGRQSSLFESLWDALFTLNEYGLAEMTYMKVCESFLAAFSIDAPAEQRVMISGHIRTNGGHTVVNRHHLRLASAAHASPRKAGQYLLLDCAAPVETALDLLAGLDSVFDG